MALDSDNKTAAHRVAQSSHDAVKAHKKSFVSRSVGQPSRFFSNPKISGAALESFDTALLDIGKEITEWIIEHGGTPEGRSTQAYAEHRYEDHALLYLISHIFSDKHVHFLTAKGLSEAIVRTYESEKGVLKGHGRNYPGLAEEKWQSFCTKIFESYKGCLSAGEQASFDVAGYVESTIAACNGQIQSAAR